MADLTGNQIKNTYTRLLQIDRFITQDGTGSADLRNFGVSGSVSVTGSLVVTGDVTARAIITQLTQSTVLYKSGSSKFGDDTGDSHAFTGSLGISGSQKITGSLFQLGNSTQSGNVNLTGNTTQVGTLVRNGNTTITGSLSHSGSAVAEGTYEVKEGVYGAFFANPQTINKNLTIPASYNSRIFGPITVAAGKTLIVGANAKLEIIDI